MSAEQDVIQKLSRFFERRPDVELALLFGSAAAGRLRNVSDIDVAVWLAEPDWERFKKLWAALENTLGRDVDLIDLRTASPQVVWAALRGMPLVTRNRALFIRMVLEKSREAEDFSEWLLDLWRLRRRLHQRAG